MTDLLPPYSPHAEEALVGAALIDPNVVDVVDVDPCDFYLWQHSAIWEAMVSLRRRNMGLDIVTVCAELDQQGKLDDIGGPAYLAKIITQVPSSLGAQDYAAVVRQKARRRDTIRVASDLAKAAYSPDESGDDFELKIAKSMVELANAASVTKGAVHWSHFLDEADADVQISRANPGETWGLRTGILDFDHQTGGVQLGELLMLTGEPGVGKSYLTLLFAHGLAVNGAPGALYSLEMQGTAVALRALAGTARIRARGLRSGRVSQENFQKFDNVLQVLRGLPIYLSDDEGWTTTALRADLARLKRMYQIQWFVVDYAYLMRDGAGKLTETEMTQLVISNLKGICKSLQLGGIVIHSMNKVGELRGSRQVEYDADVIVVVTNEDNSNLITVTFRKHREGADGSRRSFNLMWDRDSSWLVNVTTSRKDLNNDWLHR